MASNRKYAALPDLDLAPDIYETPELTDDASSHPAQSEISPHDLEEDDDEDSGISRAHLDPDIARSQFGTTRVDAREADFSDRLDSKRKSYRVSSRRKKVEEDEEDEGETSDEDGTDPSKLRRRIARLQKEAADLKAAVEKRRQIQEKDGKELEDDFGAATLKSLTDSVKDLRTTNLSGCPSQSASAKLALRLGTAAQYPPSEQTSQHTPAPAPMNDQPTYTLSYQPDFSPSHALSLAASFEARLSALESSIGIPSLPLPTQSQAIPKALLPALNTLDRQLSTLATTTPASLDTIGKRVRQLTQEAELLDEKRRTAKQSYDDMRSAASESYSTKDTNLPSLMDDAEVEGKISALYTTLPTIESIAPVLPLVLERLKSLDSIHRDATGAVERLEEAEKGVANMDEEIRRWREALERVEKKAEEGEESLRKNLGVVEPWVRELEQRVGELEK